MKSRMLLACGLMSLGMICTGQVKIDSAALKVLMEMPGRAGVNTHSYEFGDIHDTKPPKGFKPFYISHYGRHGSRTDWGGPAYAALVAMLEEAQGELLLTEEGRELLEEARQVRDIHAGMDGRLTMRGVREHQQLAGRMYGRYPEVFRKGPRRIRSISSTVQRCIVSMTAFTGKLSALQGDLDFYFDTGENYMAYIDNYRPKEVGDSAAVLMNALRQSYDTDTVTIMNRLFVDPVAARSITGHPLRLMYLVFAVARMQDSGDIKTDIFRHLPDEAVYRFWDESNRDIYMNQCNSVEYGRVRLRNVTPTVSDIVEKADEAISTGRWAADLRFGHDFPLLALASYLGLEGVGDRVSFDEIPSRWNGAFNIPFASNLQLVFYRNKGGEVLVKFLYNEKETMLRSLGSFEGPYYRWEDVKANLDGYLRD